MNFFRLCKIRWFLLGLIFLYFTGDSLSDAASFQGLGGLPGADPTYPSMSSASAISADGSTVVGEAHTVVGFQAFGQAFRWTANEGMMGLGDLPDGGFGSQAYGVSSDGAVVVGGGWSALGGEAFRWTIEDGMVGLGGRVANSVSADGYIIVGYDLDGVNGAFRWENGIMTGLGSYMPNWDILSNAYDISADGSVIVGCVCSTSDVQASRWTINNGCSGLGHLPGGAGGGCHAEAVSSDGSIVVGVSAITNDHYGDHEAFRWENDVMTGLGDLPGGDFYSYANDVSADGSVVVGYSITEGTWASSSQVNEAFIWEQEYGIRNLGDMLTNDYGLDLTGWTLTEATGISANGLTIVGFGVNPNGVTEGWIATIPEPATILIMGVGVPYILKRKQKTR